MSGEAIWNEETQVKTYETDFQSHWKPSSFFKAMVDAASNHAGALGYGYQGMLASNTVWVLSRVKIYFYRFPITGEVVHIRTWPKGIHQKLFFMRDFQFRDGNGDLIAAATTAWVLINTEVRRVLAPQSLAGHLPDNNGLSAIDERLEKIPASDGLTEKQVVTAGYSAVDLMGHVNNTRYIDWVCDCFPFEVYERGKLGWLQINYVNEVRPDDQVSISAGTDAAQPQQWIIQGTNQTSGARAFEALAGWSFEP